jgi:hypothetical protein
LLRDEELELRDDEPLLPLLLLRDFVLRERPLPLLLALDDDPEALFRAVVAVRLAAVLPLDRAVDAVFFAAVDPLLAAVFAVFPAVDAALRADEPAFWADELALRAVDRALLERDDDDEPLRERDELDDDPLRDEDEREPDRDDDPPPRRDDEDDERDDEDRERERDDEPFARSSFGISVFTTSLVSRGICFSTNLYIRSSSRRMDFAIFTVSLSPTPSASAMIAV